jgi:hypothetical protein
VTKVVYPACERATCGWRGGELPATDENRKAASTAAADHRKATRHPAIAMLALREEV